MELYEIESAVEGILFASGEPVSIMRIAAALGLPAKEIEEAAARLSDRLRYERRGLRLVRLDKQLQLISAPEHGDLIRKVLEERKPPPMSRAALEVLALVAYFQPTTRAYIERVRGVESGATVIGLCEKGLIEEAGRMDVPGRPILYRTTPVFLRSFGISSLTELPELSELGELEGQLTMAAELAKTMNELPDGLEDEQSTKTLLSELGGNV